MNRLEPNDCYPPFEQIGKRGRITLTKREANGRSATIKGPVAIQGKPPVVAFKARYLADAIEISGKLCLSDELSPRICRHPTGRPCVIMPMRVTIPAGITREVEFAPPLQHQQAAAA